MNQLYYRFWGEKFKLFSPVKKYFLYNGKNRFEHAFFIKKIGMKLVSISTCCYITIHVRALKY